eukprot:2685618-Alexandrium_andersonii.AAC.1
MKAQSFWWATSASPWRVSGASCERTSPERSASSKTISKLASRAMRGWRSVHLMMIVARVVA